MPNRLTPRETCVAIVSMLVAVPALAGVADTPLSRFSDGQQSRVLATYTGVVKRNRLQTDFVCTATDPEPIDIGVEVFSADGTRLNDIATGMGALLGVSAGQTVTIGTGGTAAFLESTVIELPSVSQGSARIVTTSDGAQCVAVLVDAVAAPPTALATLSAGVPLRSSGDGALPLPQFSDAQRATHTLVIPGVVKRNGVNTDVFCTSVAAAPVNVGVQIFAPTADLQNDVGSGNGAVLNVQPGATVTFGTTGTAAFLETTVIEVAGIAQGLARVVATSDQVICAAFILDAAQAPPGTLSELRLYAEEATAPSPTPTASPSVTPRRPTRTPAPTRPPLPGCTGDCSDNGSVTVDEMVTGVRIALGTLSVSACEEFDLNADTRVAVNELVRAVNVLLYGCIR